MTTGLESIGTPALWIGFTVFVLAMLALDLGVFHGKAHEVRVREALMWTVVWISLALVFNLGVYFWFGSERALEFLTGYVIEKALSVDNIFVFIVVFSVFAVPAKLQHRVLFWGILGALVMRAIFIVLGAALLHKFHWVAYLFGVFLVFTGIKLLVQRGGEVHPDRNLIFRLFRRFVPSVDEYRNGHFTVVEAGKRRATPLLLVLVAIEATDLVFAIDSIPAIFAVTTDPFIVYTSNIFAILGLRALYFALAGMLGKFHYLKFGLSLVLIFVGAKMLLAGIYKIPTQASLGVIAALLAGSIVASLLRSPIKPLIPVHPPHGGPADQPRGVEPRAHHGRDLCCNCYASRGARGRRGGDRRDCCGGRRGAHRPSRSCHPRRPARSCNLGDGIPLGASTAPAAPRWRHPSASAANHGEEGSMPLDLLSQPEIYVRLHDPHGHSAVTACRFTASARKEV